MTVSASAVSASQRAGVPTRRSPVPAATAVLRPSRTALSTVTAQSRSGRAACIDAAIAST
ncbi:hypothetical protein IOD13_07920 [Brevibacterium casei]|nr:hypothetical protein [Brevibacterium casei]